ncbi:MAG: ankyrin repeat domain-containing protein [Alphaproteobacteria bacterium]|nr:MAG: ankyrin repeat domain-containing protein [Alphaproteobacteria bacterium]
MYSGVVDLNARDYETATALLLALWNGHVDIAKDLIKGSKILIC